MHCTAKTVSSEELTGLAAGSCALGNEVDFFVRDVVDATRQVSLQVAVIIRQDFGGGECTRACRRLTCNS